MKRDNSIFILIDDVWIKINVNDRVPMLFASAIRQCPRSKINHNRLYKIAKKYNIIVLNKYSWSR